MRKALEENDKGPRPALEQITDVLGPFSSASDGTGDDETPAPARRRSRRRT